MSSILTAFLAASLFEGSTAQCQAPGTCTPPSATFSKVAPVNPRGQWGDSGGYCGSLSIQTIALTHGAYISQDVVRKSTGPGGGHGDAKWGYEILHTNIDEALTNLKLDYEGFDWQNSTQPQNIAYKKWLKYHLVNGAPVVWFVYCKGDGHDVYGFAHYDHIEPVWGVYSNHSLDDSTVYDDDVIVHQSDWDQFGYYRPMHTLQDSPAMDGNCKNAVPGWKHNEAYPCIPEKVNYGYAIKGVVDTGKKGLPVSLSVDLWSEPDLHFVQPATMHANVTVSELTEGMSYGLYCYHGADNVPEGGNYEANVHHNVTFEAKADIWEYADPVPFESNLAVYYFAIPL